MVVEIALRPSWRTGEHTPDPVTPGLANHGNQREQSITD